MTNSAKRQTNETLRKDMWRACDILRRDNNVGGVMEYTEHLAWLLFLKFLDEEEKKQARQISTLGIKYEPVIPTDLAWDEWAGREAVHKWEADKLIQFVRGRLLPGLAALNGSRLADTIAGIFSDESVGNLNVVRNLPVCASGHNLKEVLLIINSMRFDSDDDIYTISKVYEDLLERMGNENRSAGEFYTPRSVIRFMVEVIDPQIGETVYDPAAGSAGFLVEAYSLLKERVQTKEQEEILQHQTFFGQEKKGFSALLGTMNMVLHGVFQDIRRVNTLEEDMTADVSQQYDVILSNPPFGGKEGKHIQKNFPVSANATELLFMQHIIKKLKQSPNNARAAVIVPEGTLFRSGAFAQVKKELLELFHLFAVVSLPIGTFAPYSDVKTAILFFQRPDEVLRHNPHAHHETWYYELPLPEGVHRFSKSRPIQDEHFAQTRQMWQQWRAYLRGETGRPFEYAANIEERWQVHYAWEAYRNNRTGKVERPEAKSTDTPVVRSAHGAEGPRPKGPCTSWVEHIDTLRERDYDLSARNPNQDGHVFKDPLEILARLMASHREMLSRLENLYDNLSNGREKLWKNGPYR